MKILFEEYAYETNLLEDILPKGYYHQVSPQLSKIYYVGYYNQSPLSAHGETIIILPKIFLSEGEKLFNTYYPEQLLNDIDFVWKELREGNKARLLYSFSIWIFRAIQNYVRRNPANEIARADNVNLIINNTGEADHTELGLVLTLLRFYRDNKSLFVSVSKLQHSGRRNINWSKTSAKVIPIIQGKNAVYVDFISKKKTIDTDEELLVIFYSVLNYYKEIYSFEINIETNYELYTGQRFEALLDNGIRKLKSIKYRYFNDRFVKLWNLLYAFFERAHSSRASKQAEEILLVKDFDIVFEDMIDDLLGDESLPGYLKSHKDGKELDHIYRDLSLLPNDDIYFIGDSKYYKPSRIVGGESVSKQFTYAKNVIQYNVDLFNRGKQLSGIRYRDELTEGYNITPNFFIKAILDEDFDFNKSDFLAQPGAYNFSYHFKERLFDRDSLYVQHYNINFLFVLSCYVSNNTSFKQKFKKSARHTFRQNLVKHFNSKFDFFKVIPSIDITAFVEKNFKKLLGRMYRPSNLDNGVIIAINKVENINIDEFLEKEDIKNRESFELS